MKKVYSIFLILILVVCLSVSSFIEPVFAEKKSVFNRISDVIKYPFHSAAQAVGWDGVIDKRPRYSAPTTPGPSLMKIWICNILFDDNLGRNLCYN